MGLSWSASSGADKLQRAAVDDERRTIHDDRKSDDDGGHGHGSDERDDVLLRSGGGKHGGAECEFQPSKCDAARDTTGTDELAGIAGECAGGFELECVEWSDQFGTFERSTNSGGPYTTIGSETTTSYTDTGVTTGRPTTTLSRR